MILLKTHFELPPKGKVLLFEDSAWFDSSVIGNIYNQITNVSQITTKPNGKRTGWSAVCLFKLGLNKWPEGRMQLDKDRLIKCINEMKRENKIGEKMIDK